MKYIKKIITIIKIVIFAILIRIFSAVLKLKKNRVLFLSEARKVLDGNLKFIYDVLDEKKFEKVLSLKSDRKERRKLKEKFKVLYYLATSRYILLDDYSRLVSIMKVRKGQEICQLWHGAGAFKKFGYSRQDKKNTLLNRIEGHRNYTKAVVTADKIRWCYAEGFGMNMDNIKATGMARTDIFFNKEYMKSKKAELYKEFPYLENKKIILFAPTYRGKSLKESYYDYERLNIDKIYKEFVNKGYVFLFKWHPGLYYQMKKSEIMPYDLEKYKDFFYDFSELRDINELLLITDILITDYSSVIFDYALLNKPIVYFTYDLEKYQEDRGLYFEFNDYIYGKVAKTTDELVEAINKNELMEEKRAIFIDKFMSACDGNSTQKTYRWIFENEVENCNEEINKKIVSLSAKNE